VTKLHDDENKDIKIIASSNLKSSDRNWDYVVNYSSVIDEKARVQDHSMCMLLRVLAKCAPKKVALAGFDGYNAQTINIFDEDKDIDYLEEKAAALNKYATDFVKNSPLDIVFVTPSKYEIEVSNED
jgi:4-hydroxy 2-oxovalerate aldolase